MLLAQLIQYGRAAGRLIAQPAAADGGGKSVHHLRREAVRIGGKRLFKLEARNFPMAGGGILAAGSLGHAAVGARCGRIARQVGAGDMGKAQPVHMGQIKRRPLGDMPHGVRAFIAIGGRVRRVAHAHGVQYNQNRTVQHILILRYQSYFSSRMRRLRTSGAATE